MPQSLYLQGSTDLAAYGVPNATAQQIQTASALIDQYLSRDEGLLWTAGADGAPCYMTGLPAAYAVQLVDAINPGTSVQATLSGATAMIAPGDVLIADIANTGVLEALVVQSISGASVTFKSVKYAHAAQAALSGGMVIKEQKTMPQNRPITQVSRVPVVAAHSGVGRYGYQRRGDDGFGSMDTYNMLAVMSRFGGPPAWEPFNLEANNIDPITGMMWIPAGVLLAYYTEVKIQYVAGWSYDSLPSAIKQACANIITAQANFPEMNGNIQTLKTGAASVTRFRDSVLDSDTKMMLDPFKARMFL